MAKSKNKNLIFKRAFLYTFLVTLMVLFSAFAVKTSAYNCKAGDTECENAKANMNQNRAEANEYTKKANSVGEAIAALNSEISALNAEIASNEAKVQELNVEIQKNEKKLADNQAALAEMLIDMHFNTDSEPITILAGSKSISDYAEKQAREDVAKHEIALASQKIKDIKEKLNTQKEEAEQAIQISQEKRNLVASKKADKGASREYRIKIGLKNRK